MRQRLTHLATLGAPFGAVVGLLLAVIPDEPSQEIERGREYSYLWKCAASECSRNPAGPLLYMVLYGTLAVLVFVAVGLILDLISEMRGQGSLALTPSTLRTIGIALLALAIAIMILVF